MRMEEVCPLVSVEWLRKQLEIPEERRNIRILQASYPHHCSSEDLIPDTVLFEGQKCEGPGPAMTQLPSVSQFEQYVGPVLGISNDTHVVIYDSCGPPTCSLESAPRLWYTFKVFGHEKASVLDGGFAKWRRDNLPTTRSPLKARPAVYRVTSPKLHLIKKFSEIAEIAKSGKAMCHLLDSRNRKRFQGEVLEPAGSGGGKSGHIPNSVNLPLTELLDPATNQMRSEEEIEQLFLERGITGEKPLIVTCGTGTGSCSLLLANFLLGRGLGSLYDGSWFEYSRETGINSYLDK